MNALKKIFQLKNDKELEVVQPLEQEEDIKKVKLTFFESGYGSSKQAQGNHLVFKACLEEVYMDYKGKCRDNEKLQNRLKQPYLEEKGKYEVELKKRNTAKGLIEESIEDLEKKIINTKSDIADVKQNTEKYIEFADKKPVAQFYIGLVILLPITIFL